MQHDSRTVYIYIESHTASQCVIHILDFTDNIWQIPLTMLHPCNLLIRETHIPQYKFKLNQISSWICTVRYRKIWDSRCNEFCGCSMFNGKCHISIIYHRLNESSKVQTLNTWFKYQKCHEPWKSHMIESAGSQQILREFLRSENHSQIANMYKIKIGLHTRTHTCERTAKRIHTYTHARIHQKKTDRLWECVDFEHV